MSSSQKLQGKVALVTGASKGIGASIAKALAAEGAAVAVNYASSKEGADRVVAEIHAAGGKAVAIQGDVSKQADITRLLGETFAAFGPLDILVNNAGVYRGAPLGQIDEESFHLHFNLNVLGLILVTQEALKHFNPEGGSIINVSSVLSTLSLPGLAVYNATKSAVDGLTRTFSKELAPRKIRVNSINPGMVETEGLHSTGTIGASDSIAAITPLGRIGQPGDIAAPVAFLASTDSGWITGECLYATGGLR
ncbi:glucose 1-dehydrogenase [Luteolibacter luteus]|uniref:Glucose 1-dehydrogenase n=1 Tax=Luteolibacter luteus TaxID=2728835 RepID=A0A858REV6_9BACT|nr:glucose 1-dehydrogenase [Luteolibacter luteus]QJE95078.1 glucose 1-dehydrogenase [Luteolibacter luteus]